MIKDLPIYISVIFASTVLLCLLLCYSLLRDVSKSKAKIVLLTLFIWVILQAILSLAGIYYSDTSSIPPKIVLFGILPPMLFTIFIFLSPKGRKVMNHFSIEKLTLFHSIRIPVEIVLFLLFTHKVVPELMTFEGRNFDILAGLTAPLIMFFIQKKNKFRIIAILLWNLISLSLLLNIVINAFLSSPSPFQIFAFDQPNIAILYFPFSLLPTFIVPAVLFVHLTSFRLLFKLRKDGNYSRTH
jgi:hypothetical protein